MSTGRTNELAKSNNEVVAELLRDGISVPSTFNFSVMERMFPDKNDFKEFLKRYTGSKLHLGAATYVFVPTDLDWEWYDHVNDLDSSENPNAAIRQATIDMDYNGFASKLKERNIDPETVTGTASQVGHYITRYGRMAYLEKHGFRKSDMVSARRVVGSEPHGRFR